MFEKKKEPDFEQISEVKDRIADLSSRFYELIPHFQYKNEIAPPISDMNLLKQKVDLLNDLGNIETASKMLLGALNCVSAINPADYCLKSLNIKLEALPPVADEYKLLRQYIYNTWPSRQSGQTEIKSIFKIQRKGEAERILSHKEIDNHLLLYHGSKTFNFMGILSQGLRIAPPEAPTTGYMFGKGVYFADVFEKSLSYCYDYWGGTSND